MKVTESERCSTSGRKVFQSVTRTRLKHRSKAYSRTRPFRCDSQSAMCCTCAKVRLLSARSQGTWACPACCTKPLRELHLRLEKDLDAAQTRMADFDNGRKRRTGLPCTPNMPHSILRSSSIIQSFINVRPILGPTMTI